MGEWTLQVAATVILLPLLIFGLGVHAQLSNQVRPIDQWNQPIPGEFAVWLFNLVVFSALVFVWVAF